MDGSFPEDTLNIYAHLHASCPGGTLKKLPALKAKLLMLEHRSQEPQKLRCTARFTIRVLTLALNPRRLGHLELTSGASRQGPRDQDRVLAFFGCFWGLGLEGLGSELSIPLFKAQVGAEAYFPTFIVEAQRLWRNHATKLSGLQIACGRTELFRILGQRSGHNGAPKRPKANFKGLMLKTKP